MAEFSIDQVTSGDGSPGVSRHDLVAGEIITLTSTAEPGNASHAWEILDSAGSVAVLSDATEPVATIGPLEDIDGPCSFLVRLTLTEGESVTTMTRVMSVPLASGLRYPLFGESSPSTQTLSSNDPDLSTDNANYTDLAGRGAGQNWRSWAQWGYDVTRILDATLEAGAPQLPATPHVSDKTIYGSDGEVVIGGALFTAGDYSDEGLGLRIMGRLSSGATDDAVLRVYDMGTLASPTTGTLVGSVAIDETGAPDITYTDKAIAIDVTSGTDQIIDTLRMYEFRLEVLGADAELFTLLFGGFILGGEVE